MLRWSDNLYRLFGLEPGEVVPSDRYVIEHAHPGDRERVEAAAELARQSGRIPPTEFRIKRPDGTLRHFRATQAVVENSEDQPRRMVGSVQDITEGRRAERVIAAHLAVAECAVRVADTGAGRHGPPPRAGGGAGLRARGAVGARGRCPGVPGDLALRRRPRSPSSSRRSVSCGSRAGSGWRGEVWESGAPRHVPSFEGDARYPSKAVAGLNGAVALPALHGDEVLAVVELHLCEPLGEAGVERLLRSLTSIGHELGEFLVHRRGELRPSTSPPASSRCSSSRPGASVAGRSPSSWW